VCFAHYTGQIRADDAPQTSSLRRIITRRVPRDVYGIRMRRVMPHTADVSEIDKCFWTAIRGFL
jgi:hypothetical protein